MAQHFFASDLQINQNQLLAARLDARTSLPPTPKAGQIFYVSSGISGYDGMPITGRVGLVLSDGATTLDAFRFLGGLNQNETVVGLWTFSPSQSGLTSVGPNTTPPVPGDPQSIGTLKPFIISGQSALYTGYTLNPDTDGVGDLAQPGSGLKRYVPNWTQHLNADLLDGYHATVSVTAYGIPVRVASGHIRVPLDPTQPDHATSKQYVDNSRGGIRVRTPVDYRTTAPLPAYIALTNAGVTTWTRDGNGALSVDGATPLIGDRIMVAEEADPTTNWIFEVIDAGSGSSPWILSRVSDGVTTTEDPDGLGAYDYGDYFVVNGGTSHGGKSYVMSGVPTGGATDAAPGDEVFFNLFQVSQPIQAGRGITLADARVHFWKASYSSSELNTIPYLASNTNGSSALSSIGLYGASGTYSLKSAVANRVPKRASDVGAVFQDSLLVENASNLYSASALGLGSTTNPWSSLWVTGTAAAGKLTHVTGYYGGTTQLLTRTWANLLTDLTADLSLSSYVPTSRTLQFTSPDSSISIGSTTAQDLTANRSWTLQANWAQRTLTLASVANHLTFSATEGGSYTASLGLDLGSNRTWWIKLPQNLHTAASPTFASVTLNPGTAAAALPASVAVKVAGSDEIRLRSWASFVADVQEDLVMSADQVALTTGAVGFGSATGKLKGDTSKLFFNETDTRLGIGTASPGTALDVHGTGVARLNSASPRLIFNDTDAASNIKRLDLSYGSGSFQMTALNDSDVAVATALSFTASSSAITLMQLQANGIILAGTTYVNGRLGVGVGTPLARLHLGSGSTTLAPIQFHATINSLLTTPTAGALETDHATDTPRGRLYFTDGTATRRGLAYTDDVNFTNDPSAQIGGGLLFPGTGAASLCQADTTEVLGTGPWSVWVRCRVRTENNASGTYPTLFSLHSATTPDATIIFAYLTSDGNMGVNTRQGEPANDADVSFSGFRPVYAGKIIDFVVTKDASGIKVYVNGVRLTPTGGAAETDAKWQRDLTAAASFRIGGYSGATNSTYDDAIYRAVLYNRTLSAADVLRITRQGLDPADHWGSNVNMISNLSRNSVFTGANSTDTDWSKGAVDTLAVDTVNDRLVYTAGTEVKYVGLTLPNLTDSTLRYNRRYRWTFDVISNTSSAAASSSIGGSNEPTAAALIPAGGTGTISAEFIPRTTGGNGFLLYGWSNAAVVTFDNVVVQRIGALVDLDFSVGVGKVIPDRSGRFPATVTGTALHLVPRTVGSGTGTYFGVRKYVATISAKDNDTVDVVHNLETQAVTTAVWSATHQLVEVGITRKTGNESNAITLAFGLFGQPSSPINFTVVITG